MTKEHAYAFEAGYQAGLRAATDQLKSENAKLRTLVYDLYIWFVRGHDWGPYCAGETAMVEERMRELGMEVG